MSKFRRIYICQRCGHASPKWAGQCPECGAWNSMTEDARMISKPVKRKAIAEFSGDVINLSAARSLPEKYSPTNLAEFDRVLGGGFIKGQILLLAGPPGVGKSTLMLLAADSISAGENGLPVLYVSGEESPAQIASRAERLGVKRENILLLSETSIHGIIDKIGKLKPGLIILDSVQTVYHPEIPSAAGTLSQIRECAGEIIRAAKTKNIPVFMLGHITKEGDLAGPKVLEHMVDTVLYMDIERNQMYRILRASKNRFGPIDEIGIFEMTEKGLVSGVSVFAVSTSGEAETGKAMAMAVEGTRCLPVEVQAMVSRTYYPYPRRAVTGMETNRAQILIAAIEKKLGLQFDSKDIFASVQGGIKIKDTAVDLAFCAAVISSAKNLPVPPDWVFFGEVGILAQVSAVPFTDKRTTESERTGFSRIFLSGAGKGAGFKSGKTVKISNLGELMDRMLAAAEKKKI